MYMNGTMRSWIFYLQQRLDISTQAEHREVAILVLQQLRSIAPITLNAFFPAVVAEEEFSI
jgi:thymidylate synthase ThyX